MSVAQEEKPAGSLSSRGPSAALSQDIIRRRASVAAARNHHKALAACLAQGLDPNTLRHACARFPEHRTLLEEAAEHDALECFVMLRNAGAELTWRSTEALFHPAYARESRRILSHMFDSGELDPAGQLGAHGWTCVELASMSSSAASLDAVSAAMAMREKAVLELDAASCAFSPPKKSRFL